MKHSTGKPTKAEQERLDRLHAMPCLACTMQMAKILEYREKQPFRTEAHHLLSGNKRIGHLATIPLCGYHHQGNLKNWPISYAKKVFGPSLAYSSKAFHARFGPDAELLARTNKLLERSP